MPEETLALGSPVISYLLQRENREPGWGRSPPSAWTSLWTLGLKAASLYPVGKGTAVQLSRTPSPAPTPAPAVGATMSLESANPDSVGPASLRVGLRRGQTGIALTVKPDHPPGLPCLKVRRWQRSPTELPTLWWLGTTPALGLDAREPGGAGGDPRSPGSRTLYSDAVVPAKRT